MLLVLLAAAASAQNWTQKSPQASPPARDHHAMADDSARGQVVLFGGRGGDSGYLNDTWVWDGANWAQKFPQTSPPARIGHAMAYDSAHQQVVLFGGQGFNDTWVWDGVNWSKKSPRTSPQAREGLAMAGDSVHGTVVLFGGLDSNLKVPADTWVWDGANWTENFVVNGPSGRFYHAMATDPAHGQIVMFGGIFGYLNGAEALANETWVWDGANWTNQSPQPSPPPRPYHAMAYDSAHSQVVMCGGVIGVFNVASRIALNDTWVWDGGNWAQQLPRNSPPGRFLHAMATDPASGQVVLFSGDGAGNVPSDTWLWDHASAGGLPAISSVVSATDFGDFSTSGPGSWVEIYGSNLASTTRLWGSADFNGNNAPTSIDGVQAAIGGQKAFVAYVSPTQVNVQLPSTIGPGPAQLTVTNAIGTSAPFNVTVNATRPGLLAPASFKVRGGGAFGVILNQYVVAQLPDSTFVAPAGSIAGVNSRPAKPGETVVIYGVGFGAVVPNTPAGQVATQNTQLSASLQVSFGQAPAHVAYEGLAPGWVGLYQFNIVVPQVADNNLVPLTFNLGGTGGTQTLFTAVHQ